MRQDHFRKQALCAIDLLKMNNILRDCTLSAGNNTIAQIP